MEAVAREKQKGNPWHIATIQVLDDGTKEDVRAALDAVDDNIA